MERDSFGLRGGRIIKASLRLNFADAATGAGVDA
jgi:hypothetical protein